MLRIATRGSALALWQANHVRDALVARGLDVRVVVVRTTGDRVQDVPLSRIGDRGLFTREIDEAVLDGRADLAVHSLKDLPTTIERDLDLVAVLERADPADALVGRAGFSGDIRDLPAGARIGTSSLRRRAQLAAARPDLEAVELRGNVDTRVARVEAGDLDVAILAHAGLLRLGLERAVTRVLRAPEWLPAPGQGALAIVMRSDAVHAPVAVLDHAPTRRAVQAERAFLRCLEGGCQVPIGALATSTAGRVGIHGGVFALDGSAQLRGFLEGDETDPEGLGGALAERLLADGADDLLEAVRTAQAAPGVPAP